MIRSLTSYFTVICFGFAFYIQYTDRFYSALFSFANGFLYTSIDAELMMDYQT